MIVPQAAIAAIAVVETCLVGFAAPAALVAHGFLQPFAEPIRKNRGTSAVPAAWRRPAVCSISPWLARPARGLQQRLYELHQLGPSCRLLWRCWVRLFRFQVRNR